MIDVKVDKGKKGNKSCRDCSCKPDFKKITNLITTLDFCSDRAGK